MSSPIPFILLVLFVLCRMIYRFIKRSSRSRISPNPIVTKIEQYEEAKEAFSEVQRAAEGRRVEAEQEAQRKELEVRRAAERARRKAERERLEAQRAAEKARRDSEGVRQATLRAERRKRLDHWISLRGIQFERELAALYRQLGYQVQSTPKSGDQGIDLILTKGGKTTIVQCKGQKGPASPAVVRELYGAFHKFNDAHHAILACNAGFTQGVRKFVRGTPITLLSAEEIARMAGSAAQSQQRQLIPDETTSFSVPEAQTARMDQQQQLIRVDSTADKLACLRCSNCGSGMTLRSTKYDKFWRCGRLPECKGIRNTGQSGVTPTPFVVENAQVGLRIKQPEREIPKQPASSKTISPRSHIVPITQAREGVKQPERIVSRKPVSRLPTGPQCPSCGSAMALMDLYRGRYGKLWGCPRYPECKGARDLSRRVLRY